MKRGRNSLAMEGKVVYGVTRRLPRCDETNLATTWCSWSACDLPPDVVPAGERHFPLHGRLGDHAGGSKRRRNQFNARYLPQHRSLLLRFGAAALYAAFFCYASLSTHAGEAEKEMCTIVFPISVRRLTGCTVFSVAEI
jgi:hypothetical protein